MEYSVIIPVYNSANCLVELHNRIDEVLKKMTNNYEIIFVDDFSKDDSWNVLTQIKKGNHANVKIISFSKNYGQHNATMCGFQYCKGKIVITLDDDLQHNPEDIPILTESLNEGTFDVVYGVSKNYQHKKGYRKHVGKIWKMGTRKLDDALGEGSSYRVITREIVEKVSTHQQHFIFIDEMLGWYTDIIGVVRIDFNKSDLSKSGYGGIKLFLLGINLAVFYSSVPLKIITYGGLLMSFFSFLLGMRFIYKKIFIGVSVSGYTSLMVTILFSTSVLLICLGIIGQYLGKIYTVLNHKPTYSIKEQVL